MQHWTDSHGFVVDVGIVDFLPIFEILVNVYCDGGNTSDAWNGNDNNSENQHGKTIRVKSELC